MKKHRIVYCGYDFFYDCLEMLGNRDDVEIVGIYTIIVDGNYNFNDKIIKYAETKRIPVRFHKPIEEEVAWWFSDLRCNLIITAAYPHIIPIIESMRGINIHPSLLPTGKGPWPLPYTILSQQEESGITLHKISAIVDSGDIIAQERFRLSEREDLETLSSRVQMLAPRILYNVFDSFEQYWKNAVKQIGEGEYWPYPNDEDMTITGDMTIEEVDRIVRAFGKFDSCVSFKGKKYLVWDVNCWEEKHNYEKGSIVHTTNKEYVMAVKDGYVCFRFFKEDL